MLPTTTKDSGPEVAFVSEAEHAPNSDAGAKLDATQRRTDAVGAEVPVVVHASRYSSATLGVGKNLPPVHEETRTVIVFPNGAVVRISASMAAGELVVLTNQLTGADVICRVVNVKTQPGIQNYVNLEFTQSAPGFWDANGSPASKSRPESVLPTLASLPVPASLPAPAALTETRAPAPHTATPKPISAAPSAKATVDFSPTTPVTAPIVERPHSSAVLSGSLLGADASLNQKPVGAALDTAQVKSWVGPSPSRVGVRPTNELSSSKKILLMAGAAVLLVSAGVAGGGWLFRSRPTQSASQVAPNSPQQSVPLPPVTTDQSAALPPDQDATASSGSLQSAVVTSGASASLPAAQPAVAHAAIEPTNEQPSVQVNVPPNGAQSNGQSRVAPAPPARHSDLAGEKLAAPVAKAPRVQDAAEPPPVVGGQISGLPGSSALGAGISGDAPRITAPSIPSRVGGQIQQARLLSSPAPSYPTSALNNRIEGVVSIDVELDNTGRVVSTRLISGPPELQIAALNALRKWKYAPAMLNGLAVGSHTQVDMGFRLPSAPTSHK